MLGKLIKYIENQISPRLIDVLYTGPVRLYLSQYIKNKTLKYYLFLEGILVILFNGYNYLHFNKNIAPISINFLNKYSDHIKGKPQIHRALLLLIIYPLHVYIMTTNKFDAFSLMLFIILTMTGFVYNAYNYCNY